MLQAIRVFLNVVFFLPAAVWLGGLVMLAVATWQIDRVLQGRRTEGWQIVRKLRGLFQRLELGALAAMWISSIVQLVLETLLKGDYPGSFGTPDAMKLGLLLVASLTALYSTFFLTGAIKAKEEKLSDYSDKDGQTLLRRRLSLQHLQARGIVWLNAALAGLVLLAAVTAL